MIENRPPAGVPAVCFIKRECYEIKKKCMRIAPHLLSTIMIISLIFVL